MKKIIVRENERGLLFKNGKFIKLISAGKYHVFRDSDIEIVSTDYSLRSKYCSLETLILNPSVSDDVDVFEVGDCQLGLHYVDGNFENILQRGKYAFWKTPHKHECRIVDISTPEVSSDIPEYIFSKISAVYYVKFEVQEYQKARLYFNQRFVRVLDAGTYYFWKTETKVDVGFVDTRLTQMNVTGQEILTLDKVSLRINFVCNYRVTDYIKVLTEIDDYTEQLHVAVQLYLREYVGKYKLDEILENKNKISDYVFEKLKAKEKDLYLEVTEAGVKDIILPGEIRAIMNTVLVAEKQAQANVITRREEVASTRSLLNTAKLMDENKTLYKLKELEFVERICSNVGNINIGTNGDVLSQLSSILGNNNA